MIQTFETDEKETPPLVLMFPNLKDISEDDLNETSTLEITRLIVGTNPDFAIMKNAQKLLPKQVSYLFIYFLIFQNTISTEF